MVFVNYLQVKQHSKTKQHKNKSEMGKTTSTLQRFLGTSSASTSTPACSTSSANSNDAITAAELAKTFHTVKHNMSYNSADCGVKLDKSIYADSKTALNIRLARTKMEALVTEVLGPQSLQMVLDDLNKDNTFYSIQSDASNRKNIKLFPLVIQYFTVDNGIQNKLLDFYENHDESADSMFKAIRNSLTEHDIALDKISALSADNCNANFGVHHSLFTNMKTVVPDIIKGNCHAHIMHNTVKHAMNCLSHDIENIILKIYSHFSSSAVRREELKKIVASVDEWHELKRHVGTRWLSLLPCVDNILLNWVPIRDYFVNLEDDCPTILQNILMLNEPEGQIVIEIYLHCVSHNLTVFNKTVELLEGNHITVLDVFNIMQNLKTELEQRKTDSFFGYDSNKKLKKLKENLQSCLGKLLETYSYL